MVKLTGRKLAQCFQDKMDIIADIKQIILDIVDEEFVEDEPLIMTHRIDSLDIVEIASWMNEEYDISIDGEEITFDNFDTIRKMADFVSRKLRSKNESCS